jgi:hypothetical protein
LTAALRRRNASAKLKRRQNRHRAADRHRQHIGFRCNHHHDEHGGDGGEQRSALRIAASVLSKRHASGQDIFGE